jgi:hypothetical protein
MYQDGMRKSNMLNVALQLVHVTVQQLHMKCGLTRLRPSPASGVVVMLSMKMLWLRLLCLFSWCSPITRLDSPCSTRAQPRGMGQAPSC